VQSIVSNIEVEKIDDSESFVVKITYDGQSLRNLPIKFYGNSYNFVITDNNNKVLVEYSGLLPDLFKEEQGVVIEGKLKSDFTIHAFTVFAKHDENYMPASIQKQLQKNQYWKKNYK